jgi:hypothetical protein
VASAPYPSGLCRWPGPVPRTSRYAFYSSSYSYGIRTSIYPSSNFVTKSGGSDYLVGERASLRLRASGFCTASAHCAQGTLLGPLWTDAVGQLLEPPANNSPKEGGQYGSASRFVAARCSLIWELPSLAECAWPIVRLGSKEFSVRASWLPEAAPCRGWRRLPARGSRGGLLSQGMVLDSPPSVPGPGYPLQTQNSPKGRMYLKHKLGARRWCNSCRP